MKRKVAVTDHDLLTVVLIDAEADPAERPDGDWWGSNAWMANWRDQRIYGEAES